METVLILAAAVVALLALGVVLGLWARDGRPPLRTQREEDLADGDEEGLIASLRPAPASPIDRDAPIIEIAPIAAALAEGGLIEGHVVREQATEGEGDRRPEGRPSDGSASGVSASGRERA